MDSAASTSASSFAAALDLILLTEPKSRTHRLEKQELEALRLTCKAIRHVVDVHVHSLRCSYYIKNDCCCGLLADISPWPWENITEVDMTGVPFRKKIGVFDYSLAKGRRNHQKDFEDLVTLPLPKLRSLKVACLSVVPLTESKWPMLTRLDLSLAKEYSEEDLQFPNWATLKELVLHVQGVASTVVSLLGSLLASCPELSHFHFKYFNLGYSVGHEVAETIASALLPTLESMEFEVSILYDLPKSLPNGGFYERLLKKEWPKLKSITSRYCGYVIIPTLASTTWLTALEQLKLNNTEFVRVDDLRKFLQSLKNNPIRSLSLKDLNLDIFLFSDNWRGTVFEHLEVLHLFDMMSFEVNENDFEFLADVDISEINVLFDGCFIPKLKELKLGYQIVRDNEGDITGGPHWLQAPTKQLVKQFPLLQSITLSGWTLSVDVANYLGEFRRQTKCSIIVDNCIAWRRELSVSRQLLLNTLGLDLGYWEYFFRDETCFDNLKESYEDDLYWNLLSDADFKRISYTLALLGIWHNAAKLKKFFQLCGIDCEGRELSQDMLESLEVYFSGLLSGSELKSWLSLVNSVPMDFGDDDDIDDETFALVDKIVEEHNAKKALTQLQSQAVSPIIERQGTQNGAPAHQMRPNALFPASQPQALPAEQAPPQQVQVQRPPLPPAGGPPVGRITHAAAQLRADAAPTHISPPLPIAAGSIAYPPPPGSIQAQQRLSELEGTNKLLRTNLDNVERDRIALKQKIQQLEAKNGATGPLQVASMAEMQRQLEQMQQQLLFKNQELEEAKRRAASRPQETAGTSIGATAGGGMPQPPPQQKQRQVESDRVKRRANGTEVPVSTTTAAQNQGIVNSAVVPPPTPLFPPSTLAEMTAVGADAISLTDNPGALIARLWASCPDSMSTLLTLDTSLHSNGQTIAPSTATHLVSSAHHSNYSGAGGGAGGIDSELSRLQLILKSGFSRAAAGMVQPFTLLGSLTAYVSRVCSVITSQTSQFSGDVMLLGEERRERELQQIDIASAALTIMRHLILNDAACRHAALVSCSSSPPSSHIDGTSGLRDQGGKNGLTKHSNRITFEKNPAVASDDAFGSSFRFENSSRCGGHSGGIEASIQPLIAQLSRLHTTTINTTINTTTVENKISDANAAAAAAAATGLQALCITAALLPLDQVGNSVDQATRSRLLVGVADVAHALVTCSSTVSPSTSCGGGGGNTGRSVFLPLLRSGAVLALLRGVPPQQRCHGIQLLHALLEDPQISAEFTAVCASPPSTGGGVAAADGAADTPKTRAAAAAAAREAELVKSSKKPGVGKDATKEKSNNKTDTDEGSRSWASELMIALLNCLVLVPQNDRQEEGNSDTVTGQKTVAGEETSTSPSSNGESTNQFNFDSDETVLARGVLAVMALLLEKRCTVCFMQICHLDDTALRRRNSLNGGGGGGGDAAGLGSGGAGGSGSGNNNEKKNNSTNTKNKSPSGSSNTFTVSFPVRLIVLAEEAVKYRGDDEDVTLLRTALWPEGRSPAVRAAQSTWQHRLRLAQESLTLLRGVIVAEGALANVALEELLLTPQLAQRMLAATGRMARITASAPPLQNSTFSEQESTTIGSSQSVEMLFPPLPVAPWAYAIGSSSNAASLAPGSTAEKRAGLPCCSANDVSYLARGIRNRILYKLRS